MARASKKSTSAPASIATETAPSRNVVLRAFDAVYRFLASLKLAVISLSALAAALAYATFFERNHGTAAVQEYVYQTRGFAILLAFLGANILCAALIRFPWKRRQTGFVVTHTGLLVLLLGCWYAKETADEGQVAISEGDVKDELVRNDYPVVRVRELDPKDPQSTLREWELPFRPGAFAWGPGQPRPRPLLDTLNPLGLILPGDGRPREVLTRPRDPFQLAITSHIPASAPAVEHVAEPGGVAMAKLRITFKAPGMPEMREMFQDDQERWFVAERRVHKVVRNAGPAQVVFLDVDRPELVEDFLDPPADPGTDGAARFRYTDRSGKPQKYDLKLDGQAGKSVTLPGSDLSVTFLSRVAFPTGETGLGPSLGTSALPIAEFEVRKGSAAPVKHFALAGLPMFPNVVPSADGPTAPASKELVRISYDPPPDLDPKGGLMGVIEVMGTPDGSLYHRVWGRGAPGQTRGQVRHKGPLKLGQSVLAFGGEGPASGPVSIALAVDEYLASGAEREVCVPVTLPRGQLGNGLAAGRVEMTVDDAEGHPVTRDFFIRRSASFSPVWKTVNFGDRPFEIAYDVDRRPLGFELKLIDFDRTFDPGTEQASRFRSDVRLTDRAAGIVDRPYRIQMNEPLTHRGYTFYQSSYIREQDPRTGQETGRVQSVLQVGSNPGRTVIYLGCLLVVLGTFIQFYMRAGVFSGMKRRGGSSAPRPATADDARPELEGAAVAAGRPEDGQDDLEPL